MVLRARQELNDQIKAIQWSCWRTNTVRRTRPTPEGEARNGMLVIEETLWMLGTK